MWASFRIPLLFVVVVLAGCGLRAEPREYHLSGTTMGTHYSVRLVAPPDSLDRNSLRADIERLLLALAKLTSTYDADSDLSAFNSNTSTDWIAVPGELCELVDQALAISRVVDGAFDVTAGPLVNLWGFGPNGGRTSPPSAPDIQAARDRMGHEKLHADCSVPALRKDNPDLYVDLSAYAKGYAVDRVAELLRTLRAENFLIDIGGELSMLGRNANTDKWAVAIEEPLATVHTVQHVFRLTNTAIATSGDYRNYFDYDGKRYSHLIDTRSGFPLAHGLASVSVVSPSAAFADAMATALLVLGPEQGILMANENDIAAYFLIRNDSGIETRQTREFASVRSNY